VHYTVFIYTFRTRRDATAATSAATITAAAAANATDVIANATAAVAVARIVAGKLAKGGLAEATAGASAGATAGDRQRREEITIANMYVLKMQL